MSWKTKAKMKAVLRGEEGAVVKDWGGKRSVAIVYPNSYFVGMSNLGVHNFYRIENAKKDAVCERAFFSGDEEILSVESQRMLGEFDVVAFSVSFENDIENLKKILAISKLKPGGRSRLIAGGAAVTLNPKNFEGLVDETVCGDIEGDGTDFPPARTVVWTNATEFGSMHLVEMQRGCPHGCKFCAARIIYRPFRQFSKNAIIEAIDFGLPHRKKIGLIGGDVFAHPSFMEIAEYIHSRGGTFSPSSVRADRVTPEIAALLKKSGHKTITLAPEAGSEALRKSLGKNIQDSAFFEAAKTLAEHGISQFKLYFMIGLPEETNEDLLKIADFVKNFKKAGAKKVSVSINPFVPKNKTPLAKEAFAGISVLKKRIVLLKNLMAKAGGVSLKFESPLAALKEYELQK